MTTGTRRAVPAETGTALKDPRAEKSSAHSQSTTLGSIGGSVINWTETAARAVNSTRTPPVTEKKPSRREQERAARQAAARVRQIGPASWAVQSASNPEQEHEVHATPGGLTCTCPAHGVCWHIRDKVAPLYAAQQRKQARYDNAWLDEFRASTLLGAERLAAARLAAQYPDEPIWGGAL